MKIRKIGQALLLLLPLTAAAQDKATKSLTLTVNPGAVTISTATIPNGMVGLPYQVTIAASGGIAPYTFSVSTGTLPAGLAIDASTGIISGSPTTAGNSTFTVKVADAEVPAVSATQSYTVTVVPTLAITTASLPAANIGVAYTTTITATGGVSPYTFAVTTGSLPAGLTLNATTGVLSGTPTAAGAFTFTVQVTDSGNNIARLLIKSTIEVAGISTKDIHS